MHRLASHSRLFIFGIVLLCSLAGACGAAPGKIISDKDFLELAYAGEAPGAARVVWKRRLSPVATVETAAGEAALAGTTIGVIAAGGDDRLVILRDAAAGRRARVALALQFAAPRQNPNRSDEIQSAKPPAGLRLLRNYFAGESGGGLQAVSLVQVRGPGGLQPLLWLEYARDPGSAFFLYRAERETGSLERVYDSQLSSAPVQSGAFLYYNGFEIQYCIPADGVCPALVFGRRASSSRNDSHSACSGVSRLALGVHNLAPRPGSFVLNMAFLDSEGAGNSLVTLVPPSPSIPVAGECSATTSGEFRCRIAGPAAVDLCFERQSADGVVGADQNSGFIRVRAAAEKGGLRSVLPPASSLRRTLDAPGGRGYLVPAW